MSLFCCSVSFWETDTKCYVTNSLTARPLKMGPTACPETSVRNKPSMLCKIPKERKSQNDRSQICQSIHSITAGCRETMQTNGRSLMGTDHDVALNVCSTDGLADWWFTKRLCFNFISRITFDEMWLRLVNGACLKVTPKNSPTGLE
jgi:hypothetical protein